MADEILNLSLLKTEFLDKELLWQQQYENCAFESEVTSGQRRDVQRLWNLTGAANFRQQSCGQIAASNQWRRSLGFGIYSSGGSSFVAVVKPATWGNSITSPSSGGRTALGSGASLPTAK